MERRFHVKEERENLLENATYQLWEKQFRAVAMADKYELFRDHMCRLALPEKPKMMLDGTVLAIQAILAYTLMDGRDIPLDHFLNMQKYNTADVTDARYVFTFDLHSKAYARVLVDEKLILPDLADLYGHPWDKYKKVGYCCLWITHSDWSPLTSAEIERLEEAVTDDLRFDYSEDELQVRFDAGEDNSFLYVNVQDIEEERE